MQNTNTLKPAVLILRFSKVFFSDWSTGFGRGEMKTFFKGTRLIVTERSNKRPRCKIEDAPTWQAFGDMGLDFITEKQCAAI